MKTFIKRFKQNKSKDFLRFLLACIISAIFQSQGFFPSTNMTQTILQSSIF